MTTLLASHMCELTNNKKQTITTSMKSIEKLENNAWYCGAGSPSPHVKMGATLL